MIRVKENETSGEHEDGNVSGDVDASALEGNSEATPPNHEDRQSGQPVRSLREVLLDRPESKRSQVEVSGLAKARRALVVDMAVEGHSNAAIAAELGISPGTVANIMTEPRVKARLERIRKAEVDAAARIALAKLAPRAGAVAENMVAIALNESGDVSPRDQIAAGKDVLDRLGAKVAVEGGDGPSVQQAVVVRFPASALGPGEVTVSAGQSVGAGRGGDEPDEEDE